MDSNVALCWIKGKEKSWKAWVENRVVSIRSVVGRDRWHFVKGERNPAGFPTRISSNLNECFDGCWFSGPFFLLSQHFESGGEDISTDGTNGNTFDEVNAMHHGVESTLARIRSKYWIIKGRKTVKNVWQKCVVCKRYQGRPLRSPGSPDLPELKSSIRGVRFKLLVWILAELCM